MSEESPKTYCDFVANLDKSNLHKIYHDKQYGFPKRTKLFLNQKNFLGIIYSSIHF